MPWYFTHEFNKKPVCETCNLWNADRRSGRRVVQIHKSFGAKRASFKLRQLGQHTSIYSWTQLRTRIVKMDVDEDDDFYAPEESVPESSEQQQKTEEATESTVHAEQEDEDLEEGEEEDEADSDDSVCEAVD